MMQDTDIRVGQELPGGLAEFVSGKLHGLKVTQSDLNYHGSITIDAAILEAARIMPLEFVYIWNKATGARISTYVLPGKRGSGIVCLNGAAARTCQAGDEVIVTASRRLDAAMAREDGFSLAPRVLTFDHSRRPNEIAEVLEYRLCTTNGTLHFDLAAVPFSGTD